MLAGQAIERKGIQVVVHPTGVQDSIGTNLPEVGRVYPLRARALIQNAPKEAIFLFHSPDYRPPKNVHDRLAGETVTVRGFGWVEGMGQLVVLPTDQSLAAVSQRIDDLPINDPIIRIPKEARTGVLADLSENTNAWFDDWLSDFSLRVVMEVWDPFLLLDPKKDPNKFINERAVRSVTNILDASSKAQVLDPWIAYQLREGVISSGQVYETWMTNLRATDSEAYKAIVEGLSPRLRHQLIFDLADAKPDISGKFGAMFKTNAYDLGEQPAPHIDLDNDLNVKEIRDGIREKYRKSVKFLFDQANRVTDTSVQNLLYRLGVTTQLAGECESWFLGKTSETSEILNVVASLEAESPYFTRLLRAIESTNEGQKWSKYLREQYILDPKKESYKEGARKLLKKAA